MIKIDAMNSNKIKTEVYVLQNVLQNVTESICIITPNKAFRIWGIELE